MRILRDIVYMIAFLNLIDSVEDKNKFSDLYNQYKDLLYWIALKKVNNVEDAEECVQETFFYVAKNFEKIGQVESKRTKGYLSTIVTGFAIDKYNEAEKGNTVLCEDDSFCDTSDDLKSFESYNKIELLSVFDSVLDDESKVYFYLKYIYGYKSSEIAKLYNVKDSYIRKKLQYAKENLRKHLEGTD